MREQVALAQERASASERRELRESDQERTLRQKGEQALADLRAELAAVQARAQDAAGTHVSQSARQAGISSQGGPISPARLRSRSRALLASCARPWMVVSASAHQQLADAQQHSRLASGSPRRRRSAWPSSQSMASARSGAPARPQFVYMFII